MWSISVDYFDCKWQKLKSNQLKGNRELPLAVVGFASGMAQSGDLNTVIRKVPLPLLAALSSLRLHSQGATEWRIVTSGSLHAPCWF